MAANDKQVGGTHYQQEDVPQHWDIAIALNWDYLVGAATKYLWRLGRKGDEDKAIEDLGKAIHYLEKKLEIMKAKRDADRKKGSRIHQPLSVSMPVDFRGHYVLEGFRTDGQSLYTCQHCTLQRWMTETQALDHLRVEHPDQLSK